MLAAPREAGAGTAAGWYPVAPVPNLRRNASPPGRSRRAPSGRPRAARLLALTGLTPDGLRAGLGDSAVLGAVMDYLAAHEPDLIAAAEALDVAPEALARAARELSR